VTTMDINDSVPDALPEARGFLAGLRQVFARLAAARRRRNAIIEISRLDARLLRDMGIEPLDVYDALNGRRRSIVFNPVRRSNHE
jgi:uncharacterized protein YjiS (DUF1127 family)